MDKLIPYTYNAIVVSIYDGDTLTLDVDLGFGTRRPKQRVRLAGCNAIELKQPGGVETRDHLREVLPVGTPVLVKSMHYDKYANRINAEIWQMDHAGNALPGGNVIANLIGDDWLAAWDGHGVKPVPAWPREATTI